MPGPYAHITLLHELMKPGRLESFLPPSSGIESVLSAYFPFCALGAVSPDYPNLIRDDGGASHWADAMHCTRACEMITCGIRHIRNSKGAVRDKQLAWLLGYCAHVATDVTIHPVVQAKVGVYSENQRQHRICEMNQDSYIYRRMGLGEIGESDSFSRTVSQCSNHDDRTQLDRDIVTLWEGMLEEVYPELVVKIPPDCAAWHREFVSMVTGSASVTTRLFPLASVISAKMCLPYPRFSSVDLQYIEGQMVPMDSSPLYLHYDDIFDFAACNILLFWRRVVQSVCADDSFQSLSLGDWNLDTGRDPLGRLGFW